MYYVQNALDDLETLWDGKDETEYLASYLRLNSFLKHLAAKEKIPQLLKPL